MMRLIASLATLSLLIFTSCKKDNDEPKEEPLANIAVNNGLGRSPNQIHGYLYASVKKTIYSYGSTYLSVRLSGFFGDPSRNLMANLDHVTDNSLFFDNKSQSNVSVGALTFMDTYVFGSKNTTNYSYSNNQYNEYDAIACKWTSEGNGSFVPINLAIARGFPKITTAMIADTISRNSDYTVNLSNFILNSDSVIIRIIGGGSNNITKRVASSTAAITIKKEELANLYSSGTISFMAFNYSNTTIESKTYVLELSRKLEIPLFVVQ